MTIDYRAHSESNLEGEHPAYIKVNLYQISYVSGEYGNRVFLDRNDNLKVILRKYNSTPVLITFHNLMY